MLKMIPSNSDSPRQSPIFSITIILFGLLIFVVSGCGSSSEDGGGGSSAGDDITVVDSPSAAAEIAEVTIDDQGRNSLTTTSNSSLGKSLKVDSVITVVPEADARFPFGLSGKVSSVTNNSDGSVTATLEKVTLADVVYSTDQKTSLALNADNFIGVISPSATQATDEAAAAYRGIAAANSSGTKHAINGGIIVRNSIKSAEESEIHAAIDDIVLGDGGYVDLSLTVFLADMGVNVSGIDSDAAFVVTGSINNLRLEHALDLDYGVELNELKEIVRGNIDVDVNLNASGSMTLGYYSNAWDEVEEVQVKDLGVLSGLDGKDKVGKFPLVGLVWSIPCPSTCTTTLGNTKTPVELAKLGGVIVWVYLDAEGRITLEGEFGSRVNSAEFEVGIDKPENGDLEVVFDLSNSPNERLLELPYIEGSVDFAARTGVTLDVDVFMLGVRVANTTAELAGDFTTRIEGQQLSYGTYEIDEDWRWEGSACIFTNYGAGLILSAMVDVGLEISSPFFDWSGGFSYSDQWPSELEIETPGWHGIDNFNWWYTADGSYYCWGGAGGEEDTDGDGYTQSEGDCDDSDPNRNPGESEICNDEIDNNCNGAIDCSESSCTSDPACFETSIYYRDLDNDGYGNPYESIDASSQPPGYVLNSEDCDDSDSAINPGAEEVCGNGIDEDCDGVDSECREVPVGAVLTSTGRIWMDRNLGASRVALSLTDEEAYGDLYQDGRASDGHQLRTSLTTSEISPTIFPGHDRFIIDDSSPFSWTSASTAILRDAWTGVDGVNNPCPDGFRLPTEEEFIAEIRTWVSDDAYGAFSSPLRLTLGGMRGRVGQFLEVGIQGHYRASGPGGITISNDRAIDSGWNRVLGTSVRCIMD